MAECSDPSTEEESFTTLLNEGSDCNAPELEELKEIVTCAICLDIMENPIQLECSHTFCQHCLRSLCDQISSQCPQCRAVTVPCLGEIDGLPVNLFAAQLCDLIREKDGIRCETGRLKLSEVK